MQQSPGAPGSRAKPTRTHTPLRLAAIDNTPPPFAYNGGGHLVRRIPLAHEAAVFRAAGAEGEFVMHPQKIAPRKIVAPLVVGLVLGLAACGGGGGGGADTAAGSGSVAGDTSASASGAGPAAGGSSVSPPAEVRYGLGPVSVANSTTEGFQTFAGMTATADGYRIVWFTASFDANMAVQRSWFEQRFDEVGRRLGGETAIAQPTDITAGLATQVATIDGGSLDFVLSPDMRPSLAIQQRSANGTAVDAPIPLGGAAHSWTYTGLRLSSGSVAAVWQPASSVGPGEIQTTVLSPSPR